MVSLVKRKSLIPYEPVCLVHLLYNQTKLYCFFTLLISHLWKVKVPFSECKLKIMEKDKVVRKLPQKDDHEE